MSTKPNKDTIPGHNRISHPVFNVYIDGNKIPDDPGIASVMVNKSVNRIPTAELVLYDGPSSKQDFKLSSGTLFIPGKSEVSINLSYGDDADKSTQTIFKGIIIKQSIKAPLNGASTLQLELRDKSIATTINRKNNYFLGKTDSEAMETALKAAGVTLDIEKTTTKYEEITQYYTTGWDFALSRAEANGFLAFVDDGKISIKKPKFNFAGGLELTLGVNIVDIDAELDARDQYNGVISNSWDYSTQEVKNHTSGGTLVSPGEGNVSSSDLASVLAVGSYLQQTPAKLRQDELSSWSGAKLLRSQMAAIKGRVRIYGTNAVKPGDVIRLSGLGDRFNGDAFVSSVTHSFSSKTVWYTDIQFGYSDEWFYERYDNIVDKPAAGLLPAINGLHVGIVTDIDDKVDSETSTGGDFRVRVKLPLLNDTADGAKGIWARIVSLDAGPKRGFITRPEVNDEVIIGFINDDPRDPVILGMVHSQKNDVPTDLPIGKNNENYKKGWVTTTGIKVIMNDKKEEQSVTIETPGGNKFVIDDKKKSIVITNKTDNGESTITMDKDGVKIKTPGKFTVEATKEILLDGKDNVTAKATKQFKATGTSGAEVSSSGQAVLKGSVVKIN